ncbi:MFS transporter [Goodfellowiella coeruleoviolacea]|uniref:Major Facilitator Superfamily protein n=1 Tax=Goodfellowiella coeruleoviolacea TaxID=334858 RepID=A0AAE3GDF7_9PSEU|nr:MFS transporter [Goodfellowiella coeruleoviolacea]MCP2164113.1 Major Facilitator Superfamily protein [Goodfellowiella coeruleoviolacea]
MAFDQVNAPTTAALAAPAFPGRTRWLVVVLAFAGLGSSLVQSLVIPLLPILPAKLNATSSAVSWMVTATLIAGAIATPLFGRLGDQFGKRRMLLVALAALVAGSALCGVSTSLPVLIAGRALQGVAMAAIPLGISIIGTELPRDRRGGGIALISATLGVGGAVGLPLSGLIAEQWDFHVLFWLCAVVALLALTAVWFVVPESGTGSPGRVDVPGAVLLAVVLTALLLPLAQGNKWGWTNPLTLGLLGLAVLGALVFVRYELNHRDPLVNVRASRSRPVLLTNLASVLVGFAMFTGFLVTVSFVQAPVATGYGFGASLVAAGMTQLPGGLLMAVMSPVSARLTAARGPKTSLIAGAAVIASGYLLLEVAHGQLWQVMICSTITSGGVALAYAAMPSLILDATPARDAAAANGLNTLSRSIGTSLASAISSSLLATFTISLGGQVLPSAAAFNLMFVLGALAALLAILVIAFVPVTTGRAPAGEAALDTASA